ncbi:MAG TPA: hypothetical protein VF145_02795 [Chitinophagaceae bacterium]
MKKFFLSVTLGLAVMAGSAQKFTKVETPYIIGKTEDAKAEIDKIAADAKYQSNPEVWLWHATVYGALSDNEQTASKYPDAAETALASFRKYSQLDPSFGVMNGSPIPGKAIIDVLYRGNLRNGLSFFDKKQWDSAYKYFSRSAEIGDLITKYDWRGNKQAIDTVTVLFTGYAAQNAKKMADAASYYSRIADNKITFVPAAGDIRDVYEYLVYHYLDTKNSDMFNKYLALAKELYPKEASRWADYESEYMEKNMSLADKLAAYDKADAAGTLTSNQYLSFGNMFYNLKEEDKEKMDSLQLITYRKKAEEAFTKSYNKDNTNGIGAFNVGLVNYNDWVELDDQFASNVRKMGDLNRSKAAEKDPKKKAANDARIRKEVDALKAINAGIEKTQHAFADKSLQWLETSYNTLSKKSTLDRSEKNVIGKSVDYLANLALWKRDKAKGNAAEYDKWDALYKKYDALHGVAVTPGQDKLSKLKPGMKRAEVIALLGEPLEQSFSTVNGSKVEILVYEDYKKKIYINDKGEVTEIRDIE